MQNKLSNAVILLMMIAFATAIASHHETAAVHPAKISTSDAAGEIFGRDNMTETTHDDGHTTLDVTTLLSSDRKFASGMYKSGKTRSEINESYGEDGSGL
jgi:hypothetical protein